MKDIIANDIYNYAMFVNNGKYNVDVWTSNHVVMASCTRGLKLQC
jgi:hypothetical protein